MLTSIVGINWGDEGKGRMVDLLSQKYDVVVRYQGGNNAGHTVINDKGKFVLNLLPSGILRDETVNVMGPGMVIDTEHLFHEIERIREGGIEVTPKHLKISDKACICMPYHKLLDCLEEDRLADKKFGSTRRGISPAYSDKYMKKSLRMGDLADREALKARLADILEWKNLFVVNGYGHEPIQLDEMMEWIDAYAMPFRDYVCDTTDFLHEAIEIRSLRGAARRAARHRFRHLSLHLRLQHDRGLCHARRRHSRRRSRQRHWHHEGLFQLRGRGSLHLRDVRRGSGRAARGRRRIRRCNRQAPPRGRL